ncbi:MAG: glycosyltransferase family 4 protein [Gemmatimonadota bacterium]
MRIAILGPIAWRTPPRHYGPWERVVSLLAEGLVELGLDVTLFATADSVTSAKLHAVCPRAYEEDRSLDPKVWESLHIAAAFERAQEFDLIHNNFDFLPLTYSALVETPVVTTIHGFSSPRILPVYRRYNQHGYYVSISNADRERSLKYVATVYHGIDIEDFTFRPVSGEHLVFFGRIHPDKGTKEAIEIAHRANRRLVIAGIIQDQTYFESQIEPHIDGRAVEYVGNVGPTARDSMLGEAAALLHPITFDEPFGLSVIEAMACGTPVIAFSRGSMPELVRHGENGFLVEDVDEAVAAVGRLSEIRRERCRRFVEEGFSAARMVDDYVTVYERVLAMRRNPGGDRDVEAFRLQLEDR